MALYVAETSFSKLEKATEQAKAMLESWTTDKTTFRESHQNFNPGIPVTMYDQMGMNRNSLTQSDYENYLWLFGRRRV